MNKDLDTVLQIVGGQSALGRLINVRQQTVFLWKKNGYVPRKPAAKIIRLPIVKHSERNITFEGLCNAQQA